MPFAASTKAVFRSLHRDILEPTLMDASHVDALERFEEEPAFAVERHVARLDGATGSSCLYGMAIEDPTELSASGLALRKGLAISIVLVRRMSGGWQYQLGDYEALDDMMDAVERALSRENADGLNTFLTSAGLLGLTSPIRTPIPGGDDWRGRQLDLTLNRRT